MMLNIAMLLKAYREGFFPMSDPEDGELYWCRPHMRAVFPLDRFSPSRDVRRLERKGVFRLTVNHDFPGVIHGCAAPRKGDPDTWISEPIIAAYQQLHELGLAHSIECWHDGELAGGLYGMSMAGAFFGESMFSWRSYASQVALSFLVHRLRLKGFRLLDAQIMNPHLRRLGAVEISHEEYMEQLAVALAKKTVFL
ncbi:leucyl/phenylalanyl-tRNA--protein transferase [Chlorobium phaeovibrioides]|uniref:Leucyl/phenylalanyl-tRNA--protein transferase n=2 Tax=Chlorobium phaeovibrioides TaxID=1094 RepID=A0A5M8I9J8_CHLPH|nr:leucyl/phenylalanyl-tRNA--protein transferase [Chlorobium phaeovibrioides]